MKALLVGMLLLATAVSAVPLASAAPDLPDYECMDYYRQTDLGPVVITQRSSCDAEVCVKTAEGCDGLQWQ